MTTIREIKKANKDAGQHWFDDSTMEFFGTKLDKEVFEGPGGTFFVTSEKPPHGDRRWSVRVFDPETGGVSTHGQFCGYASRGKARWAARRAAMEVAHAGN